MEQTRFGIRERRVRSAPAKNGRRTKSCSKWVGYTKKRPEAYRRRASCKKDAFGDKLCPAR